MDGPGHYFRRIKSVARQHPVRDRPLRQRQLHADAAQEQHPQRSPLLRRRRTRATGAEDDRFSDYFGSLQSIVTSSGQNDSGLFETNLRDERYLPFENSGVISEWQLELPANRAMRGQFDYDTISDVILHVRYTAREGGALLRERRGRATSRQRSTSAAGGRARCGCSRCATSSRPSGPSSTGATGERFSSLELRAEHYPFWSQGRLDAVKAVELYARTANAHLEASDVETDDMDAFGAEDAFPGVKRCALDKIELPPPVGELALELNDTAIDELWIAVAWAET